MYRRELEGLLERAQVPAIFLLYGADEYQIEFYGGEILRLYLSDGANLLSLYFNEYNFALAKSHLAEPSLFGGVNVLHIKTNAGDKKISAKEMKELIATAQKSGGRLLCELYESDTKKIMDIQKLYSTAFARFFKPSNPDEAVALLSNHARKIGLNISRPALYELYSIENENLYLCAAELNKLSSLETHISPELVRELVYGMGELSFDEFFNRFLAGRAVQKEIMELINGANFKAIAFVNSLYRAFLRLFRLHSHIKITGTLDIKSALGYAPPTVIANLLKQQSLSLNLKQYESILMELNLTDLELKTSPNASEKELIIALMLRLGTIISSKN